MPKLKKQTQIKRTQNKILEFLQAQGVDTSEVSEPLMTDEEQLLEAQAVLNYFERNKEGFKYETCRGCGQKFAYSYHYDGIKSCSIECMAAQLRKIGINWQYGRPLHLRWDRFYPAVVPSPVIALEDEHQDQESDS